VKKTGFVFALLAITLAFGILAQGATKYKHTLVTNDNVSGSNTGAVFSFDNTSGMLTQGQSLATGGSGLGGGFFAAKAIAATSTNKPSCVYLIDAGSNDIAAFTGPGGSYAKVGNYTSSASLWAYDGGGLAVTPDNSTLISANSESENISTWGINSDCSLTHENDYTPSASPDLFGSGLAISPNGKVLLVSVTDYGDVEGYSIGSAGVLTDNGYTTTSTTGCSSGGCYPAGIAFTGDGTTVAIGNASFTWSMFVANVDSSGKLSNINWINLTTQTTLTNAEVPVFGSACAKKTKCNLFMGMSGFFLDIPAACCCYPSTKATSPALRFCLPRPPFRAAPTMKQLRRWAIGSFKSVAPHLQAAELSLRSRSTTRPIRLERV